jgi:hypothetical protein
MVRLLRFNGGAMQKVTVFLPAALYAELQEAARATGEPNYGPSQWATDLVAAELAARRLPRVTPGRCGGRVTEYTTELATHSLRLPE